MYEEKNDEKEGYKEFIRKKRSNYSSVSEKKKKQMQMLLSTYHQETRWNKR